MVDFAKEQGLAGITEKVAYHGTSWVLDIALMDKAATALNKFATVANASMAEVAHEVANAATKAPALEAITAEGIAVKVPQSAEICALSEANETVKQGGKISEALAPIAENCPASCETQYEKLKNALKMEEFTSIIDTTEHGIRRLIERGFTVNEVLELIKKPTFLKTQVDNAKVYIKQIGERFNVIVLSNPKQKVITCLKSIDQKSLINLGKNHGWK